VKVVKLNGATETAGSYRSGSEVSFSSKATAIYILTILLHNR